MINVPNDFIDDSILFNEWLSRGIYAFFHSSGKEKYSPEY